MTVASDIPAWLRYYARREAEQFGPTRVPPGAVAVLEQRRQQILAHIARHSPAAHAVLVGGGA